MKYSLYAKVVGAKYLGEVEANSLEEAVEKGYDLETCSVSVCNQCSSDISDPSIEDIEAQEIKP